jgi:hypothetical protein
VKVLVFGINNVDHVWKSERGREEERGVDRPSFLEKEVDAALRRR